MWLCWIRHVGMQGGLEGGRHHVGWFMWVAGLPGKEQWLKPEGASTAPMHASISSPLLSLSLLTRHDLHPSGLTPAPLQASPALLTILPSPTSCGMVALER